MNRLSCICIPNAMISDGSVQVIGRSSNGKESEIIRDVAWVLGGRWPTHEPAIGDSNSQSGIE